MPHSWSHHQVITTSDFATNSKLITWILGGFNHHISHHLSSQIIVFQDKEWAFNIWGYDYKLHTVYANPGDIILYEGAKRNHSRLLEYQGNNYDLIYLSYKFKDYKFVKKDLDT